MRGYTIEIYINNRKSDYATALKYLDKDELDKRVMSAVEEHLQNPTWMCRWATWNDGIDIKTIA